ncbi:hypothetical protein CDQ91_01660 [Sphingopyxis witflariensis]|uniref:TonB-dependent receptor plug domain-containing protein n=1 Tax=Sphingopyxis witflariensis TaxID=173675 RepID=A0A246K583_9SPHN|nr:hypothetical protein CDQ91_01660 [Sphingopyxis witflariensis]
MGNGIGRGALLASVAIVWVGAASPAAAQSKTFAVPAQAAASGIAELGRQADIQIVAARRYTQNKRANAVRGAMTVDRALVVLLDGTGLVARRTDLFGSSGIARRPAARGKCSFNTMRASGMLNVPITDTLGIRVAGAWTSREGFDYNSFTQPRVNGRDLWSTRATLAWEPSDRFRANVIWQHFISLHLGQSTVTAPQSRRRIIARARQKCATAILPFLIPLNHRSIIWCPRSAKCGGICGGEILSRRPKC